MEIEKRLKQAREAEGLTQEQVAEAVMVSRQTISNWENGKSLPDIISVMKLSELYKISVDELLKGDLKMQKKIEKDAAKIIANDISLRMGAYFHSSLTKRGNPNEF